MSSTHRLKLPPAESAEESSTSCVVLCLFFCVSCSKFPVAGKDSTNVTTRSCVTPTIKTKCSLLHSITLSRLCVIWEILLDDQVHCTDSTEVHLSTICAQGKALSSFMYTMYKTCIPCNRLCESAQCGMDARLLGSAGADADVLFCGRVQ